MVLDVLSISTTHFQFIEHRHARGYILTISLFNEDFRQKRCHRNLAESLASALEIAMCDGLVSCSVFRNHVRGARRAGGAGRGGAGGAGRRGGRGGAGGAGRAGRGGGAGGHRCAVWAKWRDGFRIPLLVIESVFARNQRPLVNWNVCFGWLTFGRCPSAGRVWWRCLCSEQAALRDTICSAGICTAALPWAQSECRGGGGGRAQRATAGARAEQGT